MTTGDMMSEEKAGDKELRPVSDEELRSIESGLRRGANNESCGWLDDNAVLSIVTELIERRKDSKAQYYFRERMEGYEYEIGFAAHWELEEFLRQQAKDRKK